MAPLGTAAPTGSLSPGLSEPGYNSAAPPSSREHEFVALHFERYLRAFFDLAGDEAAGEAGFEVALEETFQRTRAEDGVVSPCLDDRAETDACGGRMMT